MMPPVVVSAIVCRSPVAWDLEVVGVWQGKPPTWISLIG